ncbi:hypothetical protein LNTAR_07454 [Lentisphaera araneosa HTCC2155]|uniref:Cytochrome c domain-containing protein n=1 Tax=Lentisphaera araneosa HTCC2155 TaxID=313628 RepID=A6DN26_9BACT|nr:HEAT repeat domain-containing protein [Lentisphaera araneosa]EDM27062.1 hypothetical protein LNTAR_07454 [Lentisphaera araneosa HTCC2155]
MSSTISKIILAFGLISSMSFNSKAQGKNSKLAFRIPPEFDLHIYADSQKISNPVSITIDPQNRVYVAEVQRFQRGVEDSRQHNLWFMDELKINSLQGRLDLYEKWTKKGRFKPGHFTEYSDLITILEDTTGDEQADKSRTYACGFNEPLAGNAGSVLLAPNGEMYYANIPHIWKLEDQDGDGIHDKKEKFISGFGFRNGVNGHDLHGLEWGVDGRLYFSNGDRGYRVKTKEGKVLKSSERGTIFRCEPDGSHLEEFTFGNRNPQDLAFDQYGNLFTVDNNRGQGDKSRVCYLVELGDYGWNSGHENKTTFFRATKLNERKGPKPLDAWVLEGDWREQHQGQAAYVIPSIFFIPGGSAGMTFNPGESMGSKYDNKFLFSAYQNGVHAFDLEPDGAGLKKKDHDHFWSGGLIMDTEFDRDGRLYLADYVASGNPRDGSRKGAIYLLKNPEAMQKESVLSASRILRKGFTSSSAQELYQNLFHRDMRVRLFSQFELAKRKDAKVFAKGLQQTENELARLHSIWGFGQLSRKDKSFNKELLKFCEDRNWRVRAQIAKVLGESKDPKTKEPLMKLLKDEHARVQFYAATALGKVANDAKVIQALIHTASKNDDVFLRHAIAAGLIYTSNADEISKYIKNSSPASRMVSLLALTRLNDERVIDFLDDAAVSIVQEAVLAIDRMNHHDLAMRAALALKKFTQGKPQLTETILERLLQWNFRRGDALAVENVRALIYNSSAPEHIRQVALNDLIRWQQEAPMDPIIGQIRPVNSERFDTAPQIKAIVSDLLDKEESKAMKALLTSLSIEYGLAKNKNLLAAQVMNPNGDVAERLNLYKKLISSSDASVAKITETLLQDKEFVLRKEALFHLSQSDMLMFNDYLQNLYDKQIDLQLLYLALAHKTYVKGERLLIKSLSQAIEGNYEPSALLELQEAAEKSQHKAVKHLLGKFKNTLKDQGPLHEYKATLYGGDPINGRKMVYNEGLGQCIICHKIEDKGGVVAPDLSHIASLERARPEYLMESIVAPANYVVPGYGNVTVQMKNGDTLVASLVSQDEQTLVLKMADGKNKDFAMADVASVSKPLSSMPPLGTVLSKRDLRDIIAYLKTLKKKEH